MVNGTRTLSSWSAWSSGLALPMAVVAASDWRSVEIGGRPAAMAMRKKLLVMKAAVVTEMRRGFATTGIVSVNVSAWERELVAAESVSLEESVIE